MDPNTSQKHVQYAVAYVFRLKTLKNKKGQRGATEKNIYPYFKVVSGFKLDLLESVSNLIRKTP
jgi:hypothetical protein